MKDETKLTHGGRSSRAHFGSVNTPVYRTSTILFPDYETLTTIKQPFVYGRRGTPTSRDLETLVADLEGGERTVLTPSGLAACTTAILSAVKAGDHFLVTDGCYGPTRAFCDTILPRFGVTTTYYDPLVGANIEDAFQENTAAVFLESPSSQSFEMQDVPAIAAAARARGIVTMMDNTWGTPLFFKPIAHGVDLSINAATKYLVGHADASVGTVTANAAQTEALTHLHGHFGTAIGGDDAYLTLRGLRTLSVRMRHQYESGLAVARFLKSRPEVTRVLHPALEDDPGHAIFARDYTGGAALFAFELTPCDAAALARLFDGLQLFAMGYSWGGYESLIVPSRMKRTASAAPEGGPLLRVSIGLEDTDDLIADLKAGLERLAA